MQIQSVTTSELAASSAELRATARPAPAERTDPPARPASPEGGFPRTLDAVPEVRTDAVARGHELYQQVAYPPTEIVNGISRLIARFWEGA